MLVEGNAFDLAVIDLVWMDASDSAPERRGAGLRLAVSGLV